MNGYQKDLGYGSANYSSLPYYNKTDNTTIKIKSKCPRGATVGKIGSCCGINCTRACAIPEN